MIYVPPSGNTIVFNFPGDYPNLYGSGFLSGSFPLSMLTLGGNLPSQAEIRILYRPNTGDPGDGILVGTATCYADGTWQVTNLNESLKYDIVARISGYNDVLISDVQPVTGAPLSAHFADLKEKYKHGEEVNIQVVALGGRPPYTFTVVELPEGFTIDQDTGIISGIMTVSSLSLQIKISDLSDEVTISGNSYSAGDPHWDNVIALLHFDGVDRGTVFTDETGRAVTRSGSSITTRTDTFQFGGASARFVGDSSYLEYPYSSDFDLSVEDFTIEFWLNLQAWTGSSAFGTILSKRVGGADHDWSIINNSTHIGFQYFNGQWIHCGSHADARGQFVHFAFCREGSQVRTYKNGVLQNNVALISNIRNRNTEVRIGRSMSFGDSYLNAYLDELRITKGVARYTEEFDPPTVSFPNFGPSTEEPELPT